MLPIPVPWAWLTVGVVVGGLGCCSSPLLSATGCPRGCFRSSRLPICFPRDLLPLLLGFSSLGVLLGYLSSPFFRDCGAVTPTSSSLESVKAMTLCFALFTLGFGVGDRDGSES